ncbi:aminotransferase class V-fold PLP-dependent enzyme [Rubrivirga sp. IMCC43871]|uniref:aminotransferase class V-fold PLP-dependent enzyme n=1 Tax=Rubrivirga sp. IMCC43871 TaxID=3391575 RepID=UPI0039900326
MLPSQRSLFSLPDGLHYLNGAYQSPLLKAGEAAGIAGVRAKNDPSAVTPADFFEPADRCRQRFADLVDGDAAQVALVPAASYAMATVAQNLAVEAGQTLVVLAEQFPSHVYPWRRLADESGATVATVSPPAPLGTPGRGGEWNARLRAAIGPETALVAVPHVHWADGTVFDLVAVGVRCREVGAALVVDGTQSVGALPFSVAEVRPDALACAGYKWLLGPYTSGCLWLGERFLNGRPLEENWIGRAGSDQFSGLTDYQDAYAPGAARFDVGERSSPILLPMLTAGLEQILAWGVPAIQARCRMLADRIVSGAAEVGYRAEAAEHRAGHLFGLAPPAGTDLDAVRQSLAARNVSVSVRGAALRVSPHVYNDEADAEALLAALAEA